MYRIYKVSIISQNSNIVVFSPSKLKHIIIWHFDMYFDMYYKQVSSTNSCCIVHLGNNNTETRAWSMKLKKIKNFQMRSQRKVEIVSTKKLAIKT